MWQVQRKSEIYNILFGKHNEKKAICQTKMTVRNKGIHSSEILCSVDWQLSYGHFGTNYWSQLQESHGLTPEYGADRLPRNVRNYLPINAA
jgi:hypothetical protein